MGSTLRGRSSRRHLAVSAILVVLHSTRTTAVFNYTAPSGSPNLSVATTPESMPISNASSFAPLVSTSVTVAGSSQADDTLPELAPMPAASPGNTTSYSPRQYQQPRCNATTPPANLTGWKRWSDPATWPNQTSIPGTNGSFANVTISCGQFVLFDIPVLQNGASAIQLLWLLVEGHLMFLDDPSLQLLGLDASYIIVTGNLTIGSPQQHFRQKARITLTSRSQNLLPGYEDVGFKVLAAYGGQFNFFGMPNGSATPSWASLTAAVAPGATSLILDQDVSGWPIGGQVAISSTDFDPLQAEVATIAAVAGRNLTLLKPIKYGRFAPSITTGLGNATMPMAAEVGLLTRNILITASQDLPPLQLIGGHTIVYNTQSPQTLFGVEFTRLGQQGTLGRYPVHFHMCGPMPNSTVRANSVHDTFQRGYVIHATHGLTARDNVAFNTTGHVYMLEDGIEQNNTLVHNLAISSSPATILIPEDPANTDNLPSCFWTATPTNSWLNNSASGCNTGFWLELNQAVHGISGGLPGASDIDPYKAPLREFSDNVAHSNTEAGLQMYQHGYMPIANTTFSRFVAYKNSQYGAVFHGCLNITVDRFMVADSMTGIEFNEQSFNILQNSVILGQTANRGNPVNCAAATTYACEPLTGICGNGFSYSSVPTSPGPGYRTVYGGARVGSAQYGVVLAANAAVNNVFENFNSTCVLSGAIGTDNNQPGAIPATGSLSGNTFVNTPLANRVHIDPNLPLASNQFWVAHDVDGSTTGSAGYIVANGSVLLLPSRNSSGSGQCANQTSWGGFSCQNVCYRSVYVRYMEPGLQNLNPASGGTVLNLTRTSDSVTQIMAGNNMTPTFQATSGGTAVWDRLIYINLLGGHNYTVSFLGGAGVSPTYVQFGYSDGGGSLGPPCTASARLAFPQGVTTSEANS